jgi:hypothetical protein
MKELQSVQLERGLRIADSPGVIFRDTRGTVALLPQSESTRHLVV